MPETILSGGRARSRRWIATLLITGMALASVGCGQLSIRTWVHVIPEESEAYVMVGESGPHYFSSIEGGFQIDIILDTTTLPERVIGDITVNQLRMIGEGPGVVGTFCSWKWVHGTGGGTFDYDVFTGVATTDVTVQAQAQSTVLEIANGGPPLAMDQKLALDLGAALDPVKFGNALLSGDSSGLFTTRAVIEDTFTLIEGFPPATVTIDLALTNGPKPPVLSESTMEYCKNWVWRQGNRYFHAVNPQSGYLKRLADDVQKEALVIKLSELGLEPGDPMGLTVVGTFSDLPSFVDGAHRAVSGVFSSTDTVMYQNWNRRVPGAISAPDATPWATGVLPWILCDLPYWPFCYWVPTDIPEDFRIDAYDANGVKEVAVTVPEGAKYLIISPWDPWWHQDNMGLGFGVQVRTRTPFGF